MNTDGKLLEELQTRYNLSRFETAILSVLKKKELTANDICNITKIPKGRIYTFLNALLDKKLIEKIDKNPSTYTAEDFKERVIAFLDRKFYDNQIRENEMIHLLNQLNEGAIELMDSTSKYKQNVLKIVRESNNVNSILREGITPFIFYPLDKNDYLAVRKAISRARQTFTGESDPYDFYEEYHKLAHSKKLNFIADEKSIVNYFEIVKKCFGNSKFRAFVKMKLKTIKKQKIGIRIVKESFPYSLYVSDKNAMIALIYKKSIVGLITTSKQIIEIYKSIFEKIYPKGENIYQFVEDKFGISIT